MPLTNFKFGLELSVFLIYFATFMSNPITENFVIYRTCYLVMGKNQSECAKLGVDTSDNSTRVLEIEVQEVANYVHVTLNLINLSWPCLMLLFIGPYSDRKGRRKILIISSAGMAISALLRLVVVMLPNVSPWCLAIQMAPTMVSGGLPTFVSVTLCYLVDVSKPSNRNMRMGLLECAFRSAMILGSLCSSYIFLWIGYIGAFALCFVLLLMAFCLVLFFVSESIKTDENENVKFFTFVHIKDMLVTTFKPRESYNRIVLLGCMGSILLGVLCDCGLEAEMLLLRSKFHWKLRQLTDFTSARWTATIIAMCISIYIFQKFFQGAESLQIVFGVSTSAIGTALFGLAQYEWHIYAATALRIPVGVLTPVIRSMVSKIIPQNETGKIFAFSIAIEAFSGQLSSFLYVVLYTATMHVFPGLFDFIPVVYYIVITLFFIYIYILSKRPNAIIYVEGNDVKDEINENAN